MKRTKHINLNMMRKGAIKRPVLRPLALSVAAASLAACSGGEDVKVVASVKDCVSETELNQAECEAAYQTALAEAERTGPKYRSRTQCEAEFGYGHCSTSSNGSFFMPMMAGFMVSQMLSNRSGYYGGGFNPVYRYDRPYSSNHNRIMTADGTVIGRAGQSSYKVRSSNLKPKPTVSRTVSRGGFGAVASAKSSWGGGKSRGWGG